MPYWAELYGYSPISISLNLTGDFYRKSADTTDISASLFSNYKSDATQQQDIDRTQFSLEHIYKSETLALFDQLKSKIWYQESNNETATSIYE